MDPFLIPQIIDLAGENPVKTYRQPLASGDSGAHTWEVRIVRGGAAVDLTGCTATLNVRRDGDSDEATLRKKATIAGNRVSCELPRGVYELGGKLTAVMIVEDSAGRVVTAAVLLLRGKQYITDRIADPDGTLPSVKELLQRVAAMEGTVSQLKNDLAAEQTVRASADAALASDIANLLDQNYVGIAEKQANAVINEDGTIGSSELTDVFTVRISSLSTSVTVYNRVTTGGSTYRMASLLAFYDGVGTLVKYISGNGYAQGVQTFDIPSGATVIKVCQSNQSADADSICIRFKYDIGHVAERELNYCALGDSITSGMGVGGKSYAYYASEILRFSRFDNIAVGGKPMIGWGEIQYENVPTDTDVFTCMMGTNDWNLNYSIASFKSKYDSLITNLIARCPKIKIFLITTLHRDYTGGNGALSGETNTNGDELAAYNDVVKEIGVKYGLPVIDLYSTSGISSLTFDTYTQDRTHPNEDGHKRIAKIVANEIKKYIE